MRNSYEISVKNEEERRKTKGERLNYFITSGKKEEASSVIGKRLKKTGAKSVGINIAQAQQQHIHNNINQQHSKNLNIPNNQNNNIKGMKLEEFKNAIVQGQLNLKNKALLIREKTLEQNWHCWMGTIFNGQITDSSQLKIFKKNQAFATISLQAAEQLLNNASLFQQGLNPLQFDNGFVLVKTNPNKPAILHYAPEEKNNKILFSPKIPISTESLPIGIDICNQLIEKLPPTLQNLWEQLRTSSLEESKIFRCTILSLAQFSEDQLITLFNFCSTNNEVNFAHLEYILSVYNLIANNFSDNLPYDAFLWNSFNSSLNVNKLNNQGHEIIELCKILANPRRDTREVHLIDFIGKNSTNYSLQEQLSLIELYSEYGQPGIDALDIIQKHKIFPLIKKNLYLSPLLLIDNIHAIKTSLDVIASFDEPKKQWFLHLLNKHIHAVGNDDLPTLVESFTAFANIIKTYNLDFYPISENAFASVKSLPTTLGMILSILRENKEVDRPLQWNCISQLCFDSNAAMVALRNKKNCDIILPKMKIEPEFYDEELGYSTYKYGGAIAEADSIEEMQMNFYRYLATQPIKLPLAFYESMEKLILIKFPYSDKSSKFELKTIQIIYALLALSTTGEDNGSFHGIDEVAIKNAEKDWKDLLVVIKNADFPLLMITFYGKDSLLTQMLSKFIEHPCSPNIAVLRIIMESTFNVCKSVISVGAALNSKIFEDVESVRNEFATIYGMCAYKSMHFYYESLNKNKDPLTFMLRFYQKAILLIAGIKAGSATEINHYKNFNVKKDFLNLLDESSIYSEAFGALLALMSHFKIDNADDDMIEKLRASFLIACHKDNERLAASLKLLQSIHTLDDKWNALTLKQFIEKIHNNPDVKPSDLVKETFGINHFPPFFFDFCDAKSLPKDTLSKIKAYFPHEQRQPIEKMLMILAKNGFISPENYHLILNKIKTRLSKLPGKEANIFFTYITRLNIYNTNYAIFNELLSLILFDNNLPKFLYFAEKTNQSLDKWLTRKANIFIKLSGKSIDYQPLISEKTFLNLLSEKLLVADENELKIIPTQIDNFYQQVIKLVKKYPHTQERVLEYLTHFVQHYKDFDNKILENLTGSMLDLDDSTYVLSLFSHLLEAEHPLDLNFLAEDGYSNLTNPNLFWKILYHLINNNCSIEPDSIQNLLNDFATNEGKLARIYEHAPYPGLEKTNLLLAAGDFDAELDNFNLNPQGLAKQNSFEITKAYVYSKQINNSTFSHNELEQLESETKKADELNVVQVKKLLDKTKTQGDLPKLVALTARLLYLSTFTKCNTIQYLAVLGYLKEGKHVVGQLDTGEGKSRINMLMAACKHLQGGTVEFVTKDILLAERDYLSYKPFFDTIGTKSQTLYADSQTSTYTKGGIHFSTISDLAHFRGAAHANGELDKVIEDEPEKRVLIIDESDHIFYGMFNNHFNLSKDDPAIDKLTFVYEEMIEFFYAYPAAKDWNAQYCDEQFLKFIKAKDKDKCHLLENTPFEQRELWQESAITALEMKLNDKFMVQADVQKQTKNGVKIVSEAQVLMNNRPEKGEFTDGVHQFLHARLNYLKQAHLDGNLNDYDKEIRDYFKAYPRSQPFLQEAEKSIYYSLTSKGVINDYQDGYLYCSTATPGTDKLKEEAKLFYKVNKTLIFPPGNPSKRVNHPTYLTQDENKQMERIAEEIRKAQSDNRPYLLICEDDSESAKIHAYLEKNKFTNLTRMSAQTNKKTETLYIKKEAGLPGAITLTTAMHGRGTDIKLAQSSEIKGLQVGVTFLPKTIEEQKQLFGRAARFGSNGEAGFILSKVREKYRLNKDTLTDGFYFSADQYLENQQALREQETQIQRIIQFKVCDFHHVLQTVFYTEFAEIDNEDLRLDLQSRWIKFYSRALRSGKNLTENFSKISTTEAINTAFIEYNQMVKKDWENTFEKEFPKSHGLLLEDEYKSFFNPVNIKKIQVPKADSYHPAHDGRAVLYSRPFEKLRAVFRGERRLFADFEAWYDGRGILFPQLRAWLNGAMTTDQFLFGAEALSESTIKLLNIIMKVSILSLGTLIGAGIAAALVLTGVLAPFGIGLFGFLIMAGIGAGAGLATVATPMILKAVYDWVSAENPEPEQQADIENFSENDSIAAGSSSEDALRKDSEAPGFFPRIINSNSKKSNEADAVPVEAHRSRVNASNF